MTQQTIALYFYTTILFIPYVVKSRDARRMPGNDTDISRWRRKNVHVDESKESGITLSHGDKTTKAKVGAMLKQVRLDELTDS